MERNFHVQDKFQKHSIKYVVCVCMLLMSSISWAQSSKSINVYEHDEHLLKMTFESTMWMPDRGVTLLKDDSARQVWKKMKKTSCSIPDFGENGLQAFKVFRTEYLYIFTFHTWEGIDWTVCQKDNGHTEFQAANISAGYANGDPKQPFDNCSSGSVGTTVRFRSYEKDGPLLLEVHVPGCRGGESHHEFLFFLDQKELKEVPGSRFVINDYYHNADSLRGWIWWPVGKYSRFGEMRWERDQLSWSRRVYKLPLMLSSSENPNNKKLTYTKSMYSLECMYSLHAQKVTCKENLISKGNLTFDDIKQGCEQQPDSDDCMENCFAHIKQLEDMDYKISDQAIERFKEWKSQ